MSSKIERKARRKRQTTLSFGRVDRSLASAISPSSRSADLDGMQARSVLLRGRVDKQPQSVSSSSDDGDSEAPISTTQRRAQETRQVIRGTKPAAGNEDESDEEPIKSSPLKRRKILIELDSDASSEPDRNSSDIAPKSSRRSRRNGSRIAKLDSDESIMPPTPAKRGHERTEKDKCSHGRQVATRNIQVLDSGDSNESSTGPSRPRQGNKAELWGGKSVLGDVPSSSHRYTRQDRNRRRHKTDKEKQLELLKRRRAGENIEALTESESESESSQDDLEELSEFEDESNSELNAIEEPRAFKTSTRTAEGEDGYDSDFVVDDGEENMGVPLGNLVDIPLQFTQAAHKPLKEHFKDGIEWSMTTLVFLQFS